ncbi:MAG: hypothetical protein M1833_004819 [Piccolia ochrophora]|nr:MAG: hypothetical protein M1833_004819 [Piccolia ochrophora]
MPLFSLSTQLLLLTSVYASADLHRPRGPSSSPFATSEGHLTCHGELCYPRVFQPTSEFQVVYEDQSLPPGLYVRINLATGQKEARLNVPQSDTVGSGAPMDAENAIVAVPEVKTEKAAHKSSMLEQSGKEAPAYSNIGRIQPPKDSSETTLFESCISRILAANTALPSTPILAILEDLEELAHGIYFGAEIAKQPKVVGSLLDLIISSDDANVRAMAATVLGSSLQNNPAAQDGAREAVPSLSEDVVRRMEVEGTPKAQERMLYLLGNIPPRAADPGAGPASHLLQRLLPIFDAKNAGADGRDGVRGKCAVYVMDHLLDPDMRVERESQSPSINAPRQKGTQQNLLGDDDVQPALWCAAFRRALVQWETRSSTPASAKAKVEQALSFPGCHS